MIFRSHLVNAKVRINELIFQDRSLLLKPLEVKAIPSRESNFVAFHRL